MSKLTLAYFGTPGFSAYFLEKLLTDKDLPIEIKLVVTQPDRPVGRKRITTPSPVKIISEKYGIKVFERRDLFSNNVVGPRLHNRRGDDVRKEIPSDQQDPSLKDIDLALLFAYGEIIPPNILALPKMGFWNIHPSLLPKFRGASPIAYPLMLGDIKTGVTLIQMDEELDHGPILVQKQILITPSDRRPDLEIKLSDLAYKMFKKLILEVQTALLSKLPNINQNHSLATFTRRLTKQDGFVPFHEPLATSYIPPIIKQYYETNNLTYDSRLPTHDLILRHFRALHPWPGLWTLVKINGREMRLKITDVDLKGINKVQLEGKNEVDFTTFQKAYKIF